MTGLRAGACLSLSGRFAPFGTQAADGLRLWARHGGTALTVLDDRSDTAELTRALTSLASEVDVLFGPYSTVLMRAAIPVAEQAGRLLFNHGGSGGALDRPGQVVNVLTPARRYAEPFIAHLAGVGGGPLFTAAGRGAFARDVVGGAADAALSAGLGVEVFDPDRPPDGTWDLLSAGVYEDDIATVRAARALANPPRHVCSVAAGVASFADDVDDPDGVFGIGQWSPGAVRDVDAGMREPEFLAAWQDRYGRVPDYPGVQAYAAGVIASAAVQTAGSFGQEELWRAARALEVVTVFGRFRIDPDTGEQVGHAAALTQWRDGRSVAC